MNLSIPKPNWKWIETKSNESFVKTKKKYVKEAAAASSTATRDKF